MAGWSQSTESAWAFRTVHFLEPALEVAVAMAGRAQRVCLVLPAHVVTSS